MKKVLFVVLFVSFSALLFSQGTITKGSPPMPSSGSQGPPMSSYGIPLGPSSGIDPDPLNLNSSFLAMNFDDNSTETGGWLFIPPDPCGAAGTDRVIAVTNVMIEALDKNGNFLWRDALKDFFVPLLTPTGAPGPPLGTYCFDPKIVYDHYANRFVVVALERWNQASGDPSDESHILLAVSKTASPATATTADWWFHDIYSKINIGGVDTWADYPGFEVDEEAIYITNNMFTFAGAYSSMRLWIVDKGLVGGFYAGGPASVSILDPYAAIGWSGFETTTMPALVFGPGGATPAGTGTFLVSYSGLTYGGPGQPEAVFVIAVNNPITAPTFSLVGGGPVLIGDIEDVGGVYGWPALPDAPQLGTTTLIEVNDRRALDAVWQDDPNHSPMLWFTTTINPNVGFDPVNAGQTTAVWARINTATGLLDDIGTIGGEDIVPETTTFFPAITVDPQGKAYIGFSASAPSIFAGAYAVGQHFNDPPGTVRPSETIMAGLGPYQRTFGGPRNRWGDYSGAAIDPVTGEFWIYNEYAMTPGTGTPPEDGRWGTVWGTGDFPVPVTLTSFTAEVSNIGVTLNWTTESEIENLGFIVERRSDGDNWTELVSYKSELSLEGQGTISSATDYEYLDQLVEVGKTYDYRLADVDYNGIVNYNAVRTVEVDVTQFRNEGDPLILLNAYPNPFNPSTSIQYNILKNEDVLVEIYDLTGHLVKTLVDQNQNAGWHNVKWNGTNRYEKEVPAGVYLGRVSTNDEVKTTKLMYLK